MPSVVKFDSRKGNFVRTSVGWLPLLDPKGNQLFVEEGWQDVAEEVVEGPTTVPPQETVEYMGCSWSACTDPDSKHEGTRAPPPPQENSNNGDDPHNETPVPRTSALTPIGVNDEQLVHEMRREGHLHWVLHEGAALDLCDERATSALDAETLAELFQQAEAPVSAAASRLSQIPVQPWELTKLMSAAEQVLAALISGRYCQDYGAMLINHFGSWTGAEAWATAEENRLRVLVASDDRENLRRHIEGSLVVMLRDVMKEVNRGQLAGVHLAPSSSCGAWPEPCESGYRRDLEEEAAFQEALLASACDDSDPEGSENEFEILDEAADGANAWVPECVEKALESSCGHRCDLGAMSCCCCSIRTPRPGILPPLRVWWQQRGAAGAFALGSCRFFCQTCSARRSGALDNQLLPLPFGGVLEVQETELKGQMVELLGQDSEDSWEALSNPFSEHTWTLAS